MTRSKVKVTTHKPFKVGNPAIFNKCCYGGRNLQLGWWQYFFDMPPRWQCQWRWQISVHVKARVVNWKQAYVAAQVQLLLPK